VKEYVYLLFQVAALQHICMINYRPKNDFHVSVPIKLHRHLPYLQLERQKVWLLQVFCATGNWIWNVLCHQQSQYQVISAQFMVYLF